MKRHIKKIQGKTIKTTIHMLRWIFLLILVYIVAVTVWGFWQKGISFFDDVATLSVGGFFAFFMGYFGWRLAELIEQWLKEKSN